MATLEEPVTITIIPPVDRADMLRKAARQHLDAGREDELAWICSHDSAPEDLLLEFYDRGLFINKLGHRRGPRSLLMRLADERRYPEAIVTVASNLYTDPTESAEGFSAFLARHVDCGWMFESLARLEPSSREKLDDFLDAARKLTDSAEILSTTESRRLAFDAKTCTDPAQIERMYASRDPIVWRALASNPRVPQRLLKELASVSQIPNAADIRNRARRNPSL
jgi:hypothetical protein